MRSLIVVVVAVVLGSPVMVDAQAVDAALKKALTDSETERLKGDAKAWANYIVDDAIFTEADGTVETKKDRMGKIARIKTGPPKVSDEQYRTYGDTVIRTWRQDQRDEKGTIFSERRMMVWVKQQGNWKLASLQVTRTK